MPTYSSAKEELERMFDEYADQMAAMEGAHKERLVEAAEDAGLIDPLWGDKDAPNPYGDVLKPKLPSNRANSMPISELLCKMLQRTVTPEELPGFDFEVATYTDDCWPAAGQALIPDPDGPAIKHYVPVIDRIYWFFYSVTYNKPIYFYGDKGAGKSTLPEYCAAFIRHPLYRHEGKENMTTEDFFGMMTAKDGSTVFSPGCAPQMGKIGSWFLMDEVSNAPSEVHVGLHYMLENGGKIFLAGSDGEVEDLIITPAESFRLFCSDNTNGTGDTSGKYAGTNVLNSAFIDRFMTMLEIKYMDPETELKVLQANFPMMQPKLGKLMIKVANQIREGYRKGELSETLSLRGILEWTAKALLTRDVIESLRITHLNKTDSESEKAEIISYVQANFGSLIK